MKKDSSGNLSLYIRLIAYLRPYVKHIILVLIFNFCYVILNALSAWMVAPVVQTIFNNEKQVTSTVTPGQETAEEAEEPPGSLDINAWLKQEMRQWLHRDDPREMLKLLCIFVIITFTLKNCFAFAEFFWVSYIEQRVIKTLREEVYQHVINQPLSFFNRNETGKLISLITNDINAVNVAINRSFTKIIRDPILIFLYVFILFNISWQLTLTALIVFPISTAVIQNIGRSLKRKSRRVQEKIANLTGILQETISGIKVVKAFGMENYESRKFNGETMQHFKATLRQVRLNRLSSPLSETLGVAVMTLVLWYGGNMVLTGQTLDSEDFMRFVIFLFMMMEPIKSLGELNNNIQIALASGHRIFQLLDTPNTIVNKPAAIAQKSFEKAIEYKDVTFRYNESGDEIIRQVNIHIEKNQKIAFVGSSGAGKTTIVNLLPRFYDVQAGSVKIDGTDIRDMTLSSLRQLMGIVTQEVILFNDSVRNNISYGGSDYSQAEIENAARLANAYDFIMQLPEGFDTQVGERGILLSGGQRQRLSIARAILKNPPILIFDEATSSLDSESEFLIQEAIENLMKERTVLMIAHRLSSIMNSDKIFLMEDGRVLDEGSHSELLERSDRYRRLCELQFNG